MGWWSGDYSCRYHLRVYGTCHPQDLPLYMVQTGATFPSTQVYAMSPFSFSLWFFFWELTPNSMVQGWVYVFHTNTIWPPFQDLPIRMNLLHASKRKKGKNKLESKKLPILPITTITTSKTKSFKVQAPEVLGHQPSQTCEEPQLDYLDPQLQHALIYPGDIS